MMLDGMLFTTLFAMTHWDSISIPYPAAQLVVSGQGCCKPVINNVDPVIVLLGISPQPGSMK